MGDEIVKVKKSDLEALINANTEAYNILYEITSTTSEVVTAVNRAFSALEVAPSEMSEIVIEDEDDDGGKSDG